MNRKIFLKIFGLITILACAFSFACRVAKTSANEVLKQSFGSNILVIEDKKTIVHNDSVKWLYIEEPLDFGALNKDFVSDTGSSKISVFYQNGEFGRMWIGLKRDDNKKTELIAYFDEIVQYGSWKIENEKVKLTIQKCRCLHCAEDHGEDEFKGKKSKDPMPLREIWTVKKGQIGEENSIFTISTNSTKKYQFFDENEFILNNYDEMIAEPLKVKSYHGDRYCTASDLEDF